MAFYVYCLQIVKIKFLNKMCIKIFSCVFVFGVINLFWAAFTRVVRFTWFVLVSLAFTLAFFVTLNLKIPNVKAQGYVHNLTGQLLWHIFHE